MSTISETDWLKFLQQLHNKLRNSKGIRLTGIPALNEINNFLVFVIVEMYAEEQKLPNECRFSWLHKQYASPAKIQEDTKIPLIKDKNSHKLWTTVYNGNGNPNCTLRQLINNDFFKKYLRTDVASISAYINKPEAAPSIQDIFNTIHDKCKDIKLNHNFYDAFGSAYEQFKTDHVSNTGKHTGQHFTPIAIKNLIIDELKPKSSDLFYEPCCGSGGFIHTAYSYVHKHDKKYCDRFRENIFANECNPEIFKPLMINMLLHNIPVTNINEQNSLEYDGSCKVNKDKFDVIATNPPFNNPETLVYNDYWHVLKTGKSIAKDSTAQFLLHIYHSLKDGGRAGVVIAKGILNNGSGKKNGIEKKFRQFLLESANVYKIILLPMGVFDYTNFATAIVYFIKGQQTKTVEFYEAKFSDSKNKTGFYVEKEPAKILTFDEIKKNGWSLNIEDTGADNQINDNRVKLEDIVDITTGTFNTKDIDNKGQYPYYSASHNNPSSCHSEFTIDKPEYIIFVKAGGNRDNPLGLGSGMAKTFYVSGKSAVQNHNLIFTAKSKDVSLKYIYYYLEHNRINLMKKAKYNGGPGNISMQDIKDTSIPLPSLQHQTEIVNFLDEQFQEYDIQELLSVVGDVPMFSLLTGCEYEDFSALLHLVYEKIKYDKQVSSKQVDKKSVFRWWIKTVECEKKTLDELFQITKGTFYTKDIDNTDSKTSCPYYSASYNNPSSKHSKHSVDQKEYIIFVKDGGSKSNPLSLTSGMAKPFYVTGKSAVNDHNLILVAKDKNISVKFAYYYLEYFRQDNMKLAKYNGGIGSILMTDIKSICLKVPPLEDQIKIIAKLDTIELEASSEKRYADMLQRQIDDGFEVIKKTQPDKKSVNKPTTSVKTEFSNEDVNEILSTSQASNKPIDKKTINNTQKVQKPKVDEILKHNKPATSQVSNKQSVNKPANKKTTTTNTHTIQHSEKFDEFDDEDIDKILEHTKPATSQVGNKKTKIAN